MSSPTETNDLQPVKPATAELVLHDPTDMFWDSAGFNHALRLGRMFAKSGLAPKHLDEYGCAIGVLMARQMHENPLTVLQAMYVVSGKPGWSAQYVIARAAQCGVFRGPIDWRVDGKGDGLAVTAFAQLAGSGAEVSFTASMAMAKAEGWTSNKKYQTLPELMLRYRSATLLVRLYAPGVMLGLQTREEIEDTVDVEAVPVRRGPPTVVPVEPLKLDPADAPTPKPEPQPQPQQPAQERLAGLGLGGGARKPTDAEWATAQKASADAARSPTPTTEAKPEPVPADALRDAEAIRDIVGPRKMAPKDVMASFKRAMRLERLDGQRWAVALARAESEGWIRQGDGFLAVPPPPAPSTDLPPDADETVLRGDALRREIEALEKDMDAEDASRIYAASFEEAGEPVTPFAQASDEQLTRYLDAIVSAAEAAAGGGE